jgi:catechol 2,3-dioxygenase-like lactoylglutathione lyase family enzyme
MEDMIPKLLKDLENNGITRREVVRSLSLGAMAVSAAGALRVVPLASVVPWAAVPAGKGFKATAVNHISYNVPDYRKSRDFYATLLGMRLVFDDTKQCSLEFGAPANAIYIRNLKKTGDKAYVDHMAYSIANFGLHAVGDELKRRGLDPKFDGNYAWTIHDPDGFTFQICAEKGVYPGQAAPGAPPDFTGPTPPQPAGADKASLKAVAVNHISYNVADYARSRDFYIDLLGMKVSFDDGKQCYLAFGNDYLFIRKTKDPDNKPSVDHLAYTISNWKREVVEAELKRHDLDPKPDSKYGFTIHDADGYPIQICAKDLPDHVAKVCHGNANDCPGGPTG